MTLLEQDYHKIKDFTDGYTGNYEIKDYAELHNTKYLRRFSIKKDGPFGKVAYLDSQAAVDIFRSNGELPNTLFTPYHVSDNLLNFDFLNNFKGKILTSLIFVSPSIYLALADKDSSFLTISSPLAIFGGINFLGALKELYDYGKLPSTFIDSDTMNKFLSILEVKMCFTRTDEQNIELGFTPDDNNKVEEFKTKVKRW